MTVLFDATAAQLASFRPSAGTYATLVGSLQSLPPPSFDVGELIVLVAGTFGMLFIGLIAVAGFTVMGRRRTRAIGMLGALGAAESKVRLVLLMNGFVVGFLGMVLGGVVGLAAWWSYAPHQQASVGHVVDPAAIPWWLVITALLLAPVTATLAAWRPARAVARLPVVAALSGRPNEPRASRRNAAIGACILAVGVLVVYAGSGAAGERGTAAHPWSCSGSSRPASASTWSPSGWSPSSAGSRRTRRSRPVSRCATSRATGRAPGRPSGRSASRSS